MARGENLARVAEHLNRAKVHLVVGELFKLAIDVGLIHVHASMPATNEVERLGVGSPAEGVDVGVELLGHILLLAGGEVVDAESVAVALVAVVLHRLPSHILAVGRELRVGVVAYVHVVGLIVHRLVFQRCCVVYLRSLVALGLAEVLGRASGNVVEEYVGVGRSGIVHACLLAAGVGNGLGVGAPRQLLHATEGGHRAFVRFALDDVLAAVDAVGSYVSHERMCHGLDVVVPVSVVEIGHHSACSQWQVVGVLLYALVIGQRLYEDHLLLVGREFESLDVNVALGELSAVGSVGVHSPELTLREEGDALATVDPCGVGLACSCGGEGLLAFAVGRHCVEHLVALVLLHAVVAHLIGNGLAVGRGCCTADASHSPEGFGSHAVALADSSHVGSLANHSLRFCIDAGAADSGCDSE